jgi:hypothetical protein
MRILSTLLLVVLAEPAGEPLSGVTNLKCSSPIAATVHSMADEALTNVVRGEKHSNLSFVIDAIDPQKEKARILGKVEATDLLATGGDLVFHFIEKATNGRVGACSQSSKKVRAAFFEPMGGRLEFSWRSSFGWQS